MRPNRGAVRQPPTAAEGAGAASSCRSAPRPARRGIGAARAEPSRAEPPRRLSLAPTPGRAQRGAGAAAPGALGAAHRLSLRGAPAEFRRGGRGRPGPLRRRSPPSRPIGRAGQGRLRGAGGGRAGAGGGGGTCASGRPVCPVCPAGASAGCSPERAAPLDGVCRGAGLPLARPAVLKRRSRGGSRCPCAGPSPCHPRARRAAQHREGRGASLSFTSRGVMSSAGSGSVYTANVGNFGLLLACCRRYCSWQLWWKLKPPNTAQEAVVWQVLFQSSCSAGFP
ncbi:uncharacterized protein GJ701_016914 [Geothlypis trichas]